MARGTDDDALSWDGDDDPTLAVGQTQDAAPATLPEGFTPVGRGSENVGAVSTGSAADAPAAGEPVVKAPMGNVTLVSLGILGGVYLLYALGWAIGGLRLQGRAAYLVTDVMFQGSFWLAVLAAPLWFATVYLLTAGGKAWVRFAWLIGGVALLLPWPFVMIGAVGS